MWDCGVVMYGGLFNIGYYSVSFSGVIWWGEDVGIGCCWGCDGKDEGCYEGGEEEKREGWGCVIFEVFCVCGFFGLCIDDCW